ncbi:hypothetical protein M0805_009726 [Coniferiporia weirii]|nr:hypothetical protein M0805_009726 [Coniferiporia weirii]
MQTAHLDGDGTGTHFAYIDSGAPSGSETYTTLVCVHGLTYNAQNFSRLLPLAQRHNLRVIAFNRRDYAGSTPFSPAELSTISGTDTSVHDDFLRARGLEVARFLLWVIQEKQIPRASADADGAQGGLALLGWSFGNVTTIAFLRHLHSFPRDIVDALAPYLRTFFIYEAGSTALGYAIPEGSYQPPKDASIPPHLHGNAFGTWVSSYYTHPIYVPTQDGVQLARTPSALQLYPPEAEKARRTCTHDTLTLAELAACIDPIPQVRSEPGFFRMREETMRSQTCGALLLDYSPDTDTDVDEDKLAPLLPQIKVCVVYCRATIAGVIWGLWELEKDLERWRAEGRRVRPLAISSVGDANHFLHWEDPESFLKVVAEGINS